VSGDSFPATPFVLPDPTPVSPSHPPIRKSSRKRKPTIKQLDGADSASEREDISSWQLDGHGSDSNSDGKWEDISDRVSSVFSDSDCDSDKLACLQRM